VSIQAQVLNLLTDLKQELCLSYLFISHDLSVVGYLSDRVAVMYMGKIVEISTSKDIFSTPLHPYTRCLLDAIPSIKNRNRRHAVREQASNIQSGQGCDFYPRCRSAVEHCCIEKPGLVEVNPGHRVSCFLYSG
jgi:oligopeptide/dipeptide ABC transporter ATP-binding protein